MAHAPKCSVHQVEMKLTTKELPKEPLLPPLPEVGLRAALSGA
jgi:hypothetical protein